MCEAQLDIAEEFDLLIVIICSRRSVAERIFRKNKLAQKLSLCYYYPALVTV